MLKLEKSFSFSWKDFSACGWIHRWIKMCEGKFKTFEGNCDCTTLDILSFACPSKRKKIMWGIHEKQGCTNFGVLGRVSEVWMSYLRGIINN